MPITFLCACSRRLTVPDSLALKQARCPACDLVVNVPAASVDIPVFSAPKLPMASPADAGFQPAAPPGRSGWSAGDPVGPVVLPEDPQATTIFVLGLLGILACAPLGIIAFVMGNSHRSRVARGEYRANGMATAGWVIGICVTIFTVLGILAAVGILGLGVFGVAAGH